MFGRGVDSRGGSPRVWDWRGGGGGGAALPRRPALCILVTGGCGVGSLSLVGGGGGAGKCVLLRPTDCGVGWDAGPMGQPCFRAGDAGEAGSFVPHMCSCTLLSGVDAAGAVASTALGVLAGLPSCCRCH